MVAPEEHARRAKKFLEEHQPEKAIPEFQALVKAHPSNLDAQANLGVLLYFNKQPQIAIDHLRAALTIDSRLSKIRALLGLSEAQVGQYDAARDDLTAALASLTEKPLRKQVGMKLIEIDAAESRLDEAGLAVSQLEKDDPDDREVLYASYRIAADRAGEALLRLSLAAPDSGQMQQAIAHELLRVRDLPGAIKSFRRAIALDPNLPGVAFELAEALHNSPNNADRVLAESEYMEALAKNPREIGAAVRLGDLHAERNDLDEAAKYYQQALSLQPGYPDAALGLARVDAQRGNQEQALSLLQGVIAADPSNMLAHYRLSSLLRSMHRPEDAKEQLAEYQKIKDLKDRLRQVYSTMKLQAPETGGAGGDEVSGDHAGGSSH